MYLKDFFSHEKDLMKNIFIDKSLTSYKINTRKHLSLQVKISNLAAETKCFKYWISNDAPNIFDKIYARKIAYKGVCDGISGKDIGADFSGDLWPNAYK